MIQSGQVWDYCNIFIFHMKSLYAKGREKKNYFIKVYSKKQHGEEAAWRCQKTAGLRNWVLVFTVPPTSCSVCLHVENEPLTSWQPVPSFKYITVWCVYMCTHAYLSLMHLSVIRNSDMKFYPCCAVSQLMYKQV